MSRYVWMDWLRGLSILLVIIFHVEVDVSVYRDTPSWIQGINDTAGPLRMPSMMFLSGLLVKRSLRKGSVAYLGGKFRAIAWPYLVWSFVIMLSFLIAGYGENWSILLQIWREPIAYLWFLHHLLIYYLIAWLCRGISAWWPLLALGCLATASDLMSDGSRFGFLGVYFFAGVIASHYSHTFQIGRWPLWCKLSALGALIGCLALGVVFDGLRYQVASLPLVAAGIAGAIVLATAGSSGPLSRPIRYVGKNSLIFYLIHVPLAVVVIPILLQTFESALVVIVLTVFTAICVSVLAVWATSRQEWLAIFFVLPRRRRRRSDVLPAKSFEHP